MNDTKRSLIPRREARRLAIAVLCLAVLAGLVLLDRSRAEQRAIQQFVESGLLPRELTRANLKRIVIEHHVATSSFDRRIVLERTPEWKPELGADEGWRMIEPRNLAAWPDRMSAFTQNLLGAKRRNEFEGAADNVNGLTAPTLTMTIEYDGAAGSPLTIDLGLPSTYNKEYFARASDRPDRLFTVREGMWELLSATFGRYIDRRVVVAPTGTITSVLLSNPLGDILLERRADKTWGQRGSIQGDADEEVLKVWLGELGRIDASSISTTPTLEIAEPYIRMEISDGQSSTTLAVGDVVGRYKGNPYRMATRTGLDTLMVLDNKAVDWLEKSPAFFRERRLFRFDPTQVLDVEAESGAHRLRFTRAEPNGWWQLVGQEKRALRQARLNALIRKIASLRSQGGFPITDETKDVYFTKDDLTWTLKSNDAENTLQLSRNSPDTATATIFARANGDSLAAALPAELLGEMTLRLENLLDRRILLGQAGSARRIEFSSPKVEAVFERTGLGDDVAWTCRMTRPTKKSGSVEKQTMFKLMRTLNELEFETLLAQTQASALATVEEEYQVLAKLDATIAAPYPNDPRELIPAPPVDAKPMDIWVDVYPVGARQAGRDPEATSEGPRIAKMSDGSVVTLSREKLHTLERTILETIMPFLDQGE